MARANRHYIEGQVWHITHRCHQQEFLLKFKQDRDRWQHWLFEAKKRYGLVVLNYMITSNHIHLLVADTKKGVIARSLQLVAGRTAQEYNLRKHRKGAFWEDRYHATAIETGEHLLRCLIYIDMNMVRAGVVRHPAEWKHCGYDEIQNPPERYRIIDQKRLIELCGLNSHDQLVALQNEGIVESFKQESQKRNPIWTSIATGSEKYVHDMTDLLNGRAVGKKVIKTGNDYSICEPHEASYSPNSYPENRSLRSK